ncbi:MAG: sigma 54-interacting transcriptional regulator [Fibrobacter sp.]|nr:sigma 54-interacting transcriptional regulator [Fibrobacter sp.]
MKKKVTLLTWMSPGHDPGTLETFVDKFKSSCEIEKILYLYQKGFAERKDEMKGLFPAIEPIELALKNPTAHKEIYGLIKDQILPLIRDERNLIINVSAGTPAMHAVWLILYAGGNFPKGTQIVSSQKVPNSNQTSCDDVDFPITTYLSEFRKYERENPNEPSYEPEAKSKVRRDAIEKIKVYASVRNVPLLLLGERGIGKSRHVESHIAEIKNKKVVAVACGSLDSTLAESAIFGHVKGAFTGAIEDKKGLLEEAKGKILFLDEIQDLPKSVQRKLVRTLQDKKHRYRPLGSNEENTANIELVCASNLPEKELQERLDPDFYDRISFYKVELPPLRECREDLLDDWRKVWNSSCLESSPQEAPEDECLIRFFRKSRLPGNFRNLQSVAYQIIAWNGKKSIEEILAEISFEDVKKSEFDIAAFPEFENKSWQEATKFFHKALAKYACKKYKTQADAADALGCSSKTLQNSLKEGKGIKN